MGHAIEYDIKITRPNMDYVGQTIEDIKMTTLSIAYVGQAIEDNYWSCNSTHNQFTGISGTKIGTVLAYACSNPILIMNFGS